MRTPDENPEIRRRRGPTSGPLLRAGLCALALAAAALLGAAPAATPGQAPDPLLLVAIQQARLTAGDGAAWDLFGNSVALSGDTALVGAYEDDVGANQRQGSAYVFVRSGTSWSQEAQLTAGDGAAYDCFGCSVALCGESALVGAPYAVVGAQGNQGAAYVFTRTDTSWSQQAKLTAGDGAAGDRFGYSVALSGETALVGAYGDRIGANGDQGSAYVFTRSDASWSQQAKLTIGDGAALDRFGWSVALAGETALVGAYLADVGANPDQGSVYVFTRSGTSWGQQAELTAGAAGDSFGHSVALSGDTALVGAFYDEIGPGGRQGSAYIFARSGTTWSLPVQLAGGVSDSFGYSVALSGENALVGAYGDRIGANGDQGSAYVFTRTGTTWSQAAQLTAVDGNAYDHFGSAVALADGTALVGAPWDDVGADADQGSACAFYLDAGPDLVAPTTSASLTPAANAASWHRSAVTLTLTASDNPGGSGVDRTHYRFGTSGGFSLYSAAAKPTVAAQGATTVQYYSTDKAGISETAKTATVRIDSAKPTTRAYAATVKKGKKVKLGYRVDDPDPGCGQATVTLKIYKGRKPMKTIKIKTACESNVKKSYSWNCTLPKGRYTLKVYATDIAGNAQSKVGSARLTVK